MKNLRIEYPQRRQLVGLLAHKDSVLVNKGDLFNAVKMPHLPVMRNTKTVTGPIGDYLDTRSLSVWSEALWKSDYRKESRELDKLIDWAHDVVLGFKPKAGARHG